MRISLAIPRRVRAYSCSMEGMELVFKSPPGKRPFIGVRFAEISKAWTTNPDLIYEYKHLSFTITLEPMGERITLNLRCDEKADVRTYTGLKFDPAQLRRFLNDDAPVKTFGHVVRPLDKDEPVRVTKTNELFVLKVIEVKLYAEH